MSKSSAIITTPTAKDDHVHQLDNANATITVFKTRGSGPSPSPSEAEQSKAEIQSPALQNLGSDATKIQ